MRFFTLIFVLLLSLTSALTANAQLDYLRSLYFGASNEEGIKKYYNSAVVTPDQSPIIKAYKGVAIAMYAEVVSGVDDKFSYFGKGKKLIEEAIQADFYNPEIRFLRLTVQAEVPWVVGYSGDINADATIVLNALQKNQVDPKSDYWKKAILYLKNCDDLSSTQKKEFNKY
jgi:hypothetical protein